MLGNENFPDHTHNDAKVVAVTGLENMRGKQMEERIKMHDNHNDDDDDDDNNKDEPVNPMNARRLG